MAECIEKERVVEWFRPYGHEDDGIPYDVLVADIRDMPAADVAPVVRCKNCAHKERATVNEKGFLICPASGMEITPDDFCSYGEPKET